MGHSHLRWVALFGVSLLAFTAFLDFTIVSTALPFIEKALSASVIELQWVTNIFSIVLSATMVAAGRFADLYGRKKIFYFGVAFFAIAALAAGMSPSIGFLVVFRGLQGLGASIAFISSASIITDAFPKEEHGRAIGIYGGITGLGLAIGPVVGGLLVSWLDWRWVFWINLPLIAIGYLLCAFTLRLPPHVKPNTEIDKKGLILLIVGLGSLIYGIVNVAQLGLSAKFPWIAVVFGLIVLFFFVFSERRSKHPLIDFSIFKEPLIILTTLSVVLAGVVSYVFMFFDPLYLRNLRNLSAASIGLMIAAIPLAQVAISFGFSTLLKWFGIRNLMLISTFAACIAILGHRLIEIDTPLWFLLIPFAILGINWGLSNAGIIVGVNHCIQPSKTGEAIGSIATVWNFIGSIFLALSTAIFHVGSQKSFLDGFHAMTNFNIGFAILILIFSLLILRKLKRSEANIHRSE